MSTVPHVIRNGDPEQTYPGDEYLTVILNIKHACVASFLFVLLYEYNEIF